MPMKRENIWNIQQPHIAINVGDSLEELWRPKEELDQVCIAICGLSDPSVSQGLYLKDFDGHEVEIVVDDPVVNWTEHHFLV